MKRPLNRAFSLIEVTVVMAVSSTLMVIAVGGIHQTIKFGSLVRKRQMFHQNMLRLGDQLRDDIHFGQSLKLDGDKQLVIGAEGVPRVTYTIESIGVARMTSDEAGITAHDTFPLAPGTTVRWDSSELPKTISLVVVRERGTSAEIDSDSLDDHQNRPTDLHVKATVGRWHSTTEVIR